MNYNQESGLKKYFDDIGRIQAQIINENRLPDETLEETRSRLNKQFGRTIQGYKKRCTSEIYPEVIELKRMHEDCSKTARELAGLNLSLVVSIAEEYTGKGISLPELIQAGNVGLMKATTKYNPYYDLKEYPNGIEFSTYATKSITRAIKKAFQQKLRKNLSIPYNICPQRRIINRISSRLEIELGREPDNQEVADRFNQTHYLKGKKKSQDQSRTHRGIKDGRLF